MQQKLQYIIVAIGLLCLLGACQSKRNKKELPVAKQGLLSLENWDIDKIPQIALTGEWEFYWNKYLSPQDFQSHDKPTLPYLATLPQVWNRHRIPNLSISAKGYATYRLKIRLPKNAPALALKIPTVSMAYVLYINGQKVSSAGVIGKTKQQSTPAYHPQVIDLPNHPTSLELVLQVANFYHRKGGVWRALTIGTAPSIKHTWLKTTMADLFLLGSILIMALYHLGLYFIRRRENSPLYFSLFCLWVSIRIITTGDYLINYIIDLHPVFIIRLEYITFFMGGLFFASFVRSIFAKDIHSIPVKVYQIAALLFTFVALFTSISFFTTVVVGFQVFTLASGTYLILRLIKATIHKRESSTAFLIGWLILFLAILNDILYTNYLVNTGYFAGLGLFLFIFSQAFLLSSRFSKSFKQAENLTQELDYTNKNLELIVANRTASLQEANEELQSLNEFKEAMAGMVVHDLKNPLNSIINLTEQVTIKEAGKQMLDLVTNILDIQKLETAQLNLIQKGVNLRSLAHKALSQVSYLIEAKDLRIHNRCTATYWVNIDEEIIQRVMTNLLTNAIKYTPEGGEISLEATIQKKKLVKVWVKDNGIGIPKDKQNLIFDKFGQVEARQSGVARASGLGLTFCKLATEAHGGTIGVRSLPGQGAEFWFTIPLDSIQTVEETYDSVAQKDLFGRNQKRIPKPFKSFDFQLSVEDKAVLAPYLPEFQQLDVYEVSSLRRLIAKIDVQDRESLQLWLKEITKAMYACNEDKYYALLGVA